MKVFVLSKERKPLMPTTPRRARLWLKAKRARVVCREPFTIQLRFATAAYTQPVTVGVDMGSQTVGVAAKSPGEVVYQAEVALRTAIASKLTQRRTYRRNRRSRKTRYRVARFANRRRPAGWLPPSLRSKAEATVKTVGFVASILPVTQVRVEVGSFDTQKLQHPEISGVAYQQGELHGYLIREYLLAKWKRRCVYCGASHTQLQVEHIIPVARGGSNRASNLTLACAPCNVRKGNQTAAEFGYPEVQAQAKAPLKDAAQVSSIKTVVVDQLAAQFGSARVAVTHGYETKYQRIQVLGLAKSHANDAVAIACEIGEVVTTLSAVHQIRCLPRGNYQCYNGKRSEHKVWAPRKIQGWKLFELVKAKGQVGYIGGRRVKGAFVVKDVRSGKPLLEVTPHKLQRLARPLHGSLIMRLAAPTSTAKEGGASSPV